MNQDFFNQMAQSIVDGNPKAAAIVAQAALDAGIDPLEAITQGFVIGVDRVGAAFTNGDAFLPELVMAGEAMKAGVAVLEPEMHRRGTERKTQGRVVLATVEGDIHEIGKSLVGTMLTAAGFDVFDLGVNVPADKILSKVREVSASIIGLSALLTTTMGRQREVIEALEKEGLRPVVKVMVGGAPVTRDWVTQIGADGYSEDAIGAVAVAKQLVSVS
jgi:corrinoid protein of di/trimethylamine methyltransferase